MYRDWRPPDGSTHFHDHQEQAEVESTRAFLEASWKMRIARLDIENFSVITREQGEASDGSLAAM